MITISEEKTADQFKYRATITTLDGKKYHFILASVENFLYKLDLAQREMGKIPNNFVPVKYANDHNEGSDNALLTFMMAGFFGLFLL